MRAVPQYDQEECWQLPTSRKLDSGRLSFPQLLFLPVHQSASPAAAIDTERLVTVGTMDEQRHLNGGHDNPVNVETDSDVEDRNHFEVTRQSRAAVQSQQRRDVSALLGEKMLQVSCRTSC